MCGLLRVAFVTLLVLCVSPQAFAATNGRIVYSVNSTTPQARTYASATLAGAIPTCVVNKRAPTRNENLVGYVTTGGGNGRADRQLPLVPHRSSLSGG